MKDDLDLDMFALKMCGFMKYICMPNMKSLPVLFQKLWPMLKLDTNKPTDDQQTNQQMTNKQTDRTKTICPPHRGIITTTIVQDV